MKAEIQALEQALSEVVTGRQRLDAAADLIRNSLAALRQAELAAERAAMAAAAAWEARDQAATAQAARELAEEDAAVFRAKKIAAQLEPMMEVVAKLAQRYFLDRQAHRKDEPREDERGRERKPRKRAARKDAPPNGQS